MGRPTWLLTLAAPVAAFVAVAWWHDVPSTLTQADEVAIEIILAGHEVARAPADYEQQVATVAAVQDAVFAASARYRAIPQGHTREPADLLLMGHGLCFDRSRTIEKALQAVGMEVRHVAVYESWVELLFTATKDSHALTEVKTSRGWMLVDSVADWRGIDARGDPVSAERLGAGGVDLATPVPEAVSILDDGFVAVIGLYSRHGLFYPPFAPFPDVDWVQLAQNL